MATLSKKTLTINTTMDTKDKPAKSPALSIDSGIGLGSPTSTGRPMTTADLAYSPTETRGFENMAPPESPVAVMVNGRAVNASVVEAMGRDLAEARANGEFPTTTTPNYEVQPLFDDHARLLRLREARGGSPREEWNRNREATELLVEYTRAIRQRDSFRRDQTEATTVQDRIAKMVRGLHGETNFYRLVQHAVHHAIQDQAVKQDLATGGTTMSHILDLIRGVVQEQAATGRNGVTEENMEDVLEQIFGMIEHALDAAGPIRLSANRLNTDVNRMDNITNAQQSLTDAHQSLMTAQESHVNVISGQFSALDNNLGSMGNLLNSTNGNITAMTSQLGILQTIVIMLPEMVAQAVKETLKEILPRAAQEAIVPIIVASLQASLGAPSNGVSGKSASSTEFDEKVSGTKKSPTGHQKKKSPGFFKRLFGGSPNKRGNSHDDDATTGGASGVCF